MISTPVSCSGGHADSVNVIVLVQGQGVKASFYVTTYTSETSLPSYNLSFHEIFQPKFYIHFSYLHASFANHRVFLDTVLGEEFKL
jgi:hypothetical protein